MMRLFLTSALIFGFTGSAAAQSNDETEIRLGAALATTPQYAGSSEQILRVLPLISFEDLAGFDLNGLSLTYPILDIGTGRGPGTWSVKAGARAGFDFGRDSADSPTLTGFEDIGASLLVGGFVQANYGVIGLNIEAGQDVIDGHDGFIADFSVGTFIPPGIIADNLALRPSVTLSWADGSHNQTVYGVTPEQAALSGLNVDDLDAGLHRASVNLLGFYNIDERWQIFSLTSYREYIGEARDSPILQAPDGATSDIFAMLGLSYKFSL